MTGLDVTALSSTCDHNYVWTANCGHRGNLNRLSWHQSVFHSCIFL